MRPPGRTVPGNRWDLLDGLEPAEPPRVSVVVVHYRQPAELARTLAALARQTHPAGRLEVIVVDDGSPQAPRVPAGVRLVRQVDRGFRAAAARNLGARAATGEVLCFLDADTAPEPGYVAALSRLPALAPEVVVVGRRRHADLAGSEPVEVAGPATELPSPAWLEEAYATSGDLLRADDRSYRFVISAVLGCSAWLFAELGGFDERFTSYGGEDWEWAHRAWRAGALLAHVPSAVAWHDGPDWAGRAGERAAKNAEALMLADRIPVPGSRGRGVRSAGADVVVRLAAAPSLAAAYVCVDDVLTALPEAYVVVPSEHAPAFAADPRVRAAAPAGARVHVELTAPVHLLAPGLRDALDVLAAEGLGSLVLEARDGAEIRLVSARAVARTCRWGDPSLFPERRLPVEWFAATGGEPDLEAHLGGWAGGG